MRAEPGAQLALRTLDGPFNIGRAILVAAIHFVEQGQSFVEPSDDGDQLAMRIPIRCHPCPKNSAALEPVPMHASVRRLADGLPR